MALSQMVSCIMPTRNRRGLSPVDLVLPPSGLFSKELIVLDDGEMRLPTWS
jgi:hypothetical protein